MLSDSGLKAMCSFVLLLVSYTVILVSVRWHSSEGMAKARATLTAHIAVVTLFVGPASSFMPGLLAVSQWISFYQYLIQLLLLF